MTMPFGKWKGIEINEIPLTYLEWCVGQNFEPILREAITNEINRRTNPQKGTTVQLPKQVFMEQLGALLMKCPDEFLTNEWKLTIPRGIFHFNIKKVG